MIHPILANLHAVGVLCVTASEVCDIHSEEGFDNLFRAVLAAAHAINEIGPMLLTMGAERGLTIEHFDGLVLDVACEGQAENLTPEDFSA
jgi:hypothetical protein